MAGAFAQGNAGLNEEVEGTIDILETTPASGRAMGERLAGYGRSYLPPILRRMSPQQRDAAVRRVQRVRDKAPAGSYRAALDRLATAMAGVR